MRYVTSIEQLGRQEGRMEGRVEGRVEGRMEGETDLFRLMLTRRFGDLSSSIETRIANASEDQLRHWATRLFDASSLDEVLRDDLH